MPRFFFLSERKMCQNCSGHLLPIPLAILIATLSTYFSYSEAAYYRYEECKPVPYSCGSVKFNLSYPFRLDKTRPDYCGYHGFDLECPQNASGPRIYVGKVGFEVTDIDMMNHIITLVDPTLAQQSCPTVSYNLSIDETMYNLTDRDRQVSVYHNCTIPISEPTFHQIDCLKGQTDTYSYYTVGSGNMPFNLSGNCSFMSSVPLQVKYVDLLERGSEPFEYLIKKGFTLRWRIGRRWCSDCTSSGGYCGYDSSSPDAPTCFCPEGPANGTCPGYPGGSNVRTAAIVGGAVASVALLLLIFGALLYVFQRRRQRQRSLVSSQLLSQTTSSVDHATEPESGGALSRTAVFTYEALREATNCFHESKELGDGGFGTVYRGVLRDGRVVAVKRLYGNNHRRAEQYVNEVAILSQLRHPNLVSLYGCTPLRSQELLLVYEFVPNGTVADHLHGSRASERALCWPRRLNIAVESAIALAYLHAVEPPIIHRDVKTSNILLDADFHVKVADFGLSRLIPHAATHVSTAPQGTPGYVDPEYHRSFQLTDKSDVYSFGVVLVELISSKQAVDLSRSKDQINLANMAVNMIQQSELDKLIDPELMLVSDPLVPKMVTMVAELAFRCLQPDGDMRPPIKEVCEVLQRIKTIARKEDTDDDGTCRIHKSSESAAAAAGQIGMSPITVTTRWSSTSTTPNTSK